MRVICFSLLILFVSSCKTPVADKSLSGVYTSRVDSVLALMTLDEKIGQMTLFTTDWGSTGPTIREGYEEYIRKGSCGALFNSHTVAFTRHLQKVAV